MKCTIDGAKDYLPIYPMSSRFNQISASSHRHRTIDGAFLAKSCALQGPTRHFSPTARWLLWCVLEPYCRDIPLRRLAIPRWRLTVDQTVPIKSASAQLRLGMHCSFRSTAAATTPHPGWRTRAELQRRRARNAGAPRRSTSQMFKEARHRFCARVDVTFQLACVDIGRATRLGFEQRPRQIGAGPSGRGGGRQSFSQRIQRR